MKITMALLAAGCSQRFGRPKLIEPLDGGSILDGSMKNIIDLKNEITGIEVKNILILGAYKDEILNASDKNLVKEFGVLENKHWINGISSSLNLAASYSLSELSDGMMLFFGDMPFISHIFVKKLLEIILSTGREKIVRPVFNGIPGFPVYFHKNFLKEFLRLTGNNGARQIIGKNRESFIPVCTDYKNSTLDIDTYDDYVNMKNTVIMR